MAESSLCWAFQRSFVDYVARLADGRIAAFGGAEVLADGSFAFPAAERTAEQTAEQTGGALEETPGARCFAGGIGFTGHHGMMAVTISAPALVPGDRPGEPAVLSIDDPFEPGQRLVLATLSPALPPGDPTDPPAPAPHDAVDPAPVVPRLTELGADLFQGIYPPGMALEPLVLEHLTTPDAKDHR